MKAKNTKTIRNFLIAALLIFLALPIIFPETNPIKILKKENIFKREESPLPIFSKNNPITNYVKRLKEFYSLEKKDEFSKEETSANQENEISSYDLFFANDDEDEAQILFADAEQIDNSIDLENGIVRTIDGLILNPTQEGYYYEGQFYKNGTYPANANKNNIERALSRYHNTIARNSGKKAIYLADDKGNLTVDYVAEYPDTVFGNIENYLAKNNFLGANKDIGTFAKADKLDYEKYRGATVNGLNNRSNYSGSNSGSTGNADIAKASLTDMHSAYTIALQKIKSGELLKENNMEKPENIINKPVIDAINQMPAAEDPTASFPTESFCKGNECDNAFTIAPIIQEQDDSDLSNYYHSFCEETCPPFTNNFHDNQELVSDFDINLPEKIEYLKKKLQESDKKIIEIGYMHLNPQVLEYYANLAQELNNMGITNANQEQVEIRFRNFDFNPKNPGDNFGEKLIAPMRTNISRDIINNNPDEDLLSESNDPVASLAKEYQNIYDNVQNEYKDKKQLQNTLNRFNIHDDPKDMPVAIVQKPFKGANPNTFVVNSSFIPGGYRTEIPEWEKYRKETKYGSTYYEVPREVLLNNSPKDLAIVFLQNGDKEEEITLSDNHPVNTMSIQDIFNFNKDRVHQNVSKIYETQAITAIHNAKQNRTPIKIDNIESRKVSLIPNN